MLTFEQIKELIELVAAHRLSGLEIERSGFRLTIDGYPVASPAQPAQAGSGSTQPAAPSVSAQPAQPPPPPAAESAEPAPTEKASAAAVEGHRLTSPIVGTFYRAPSPDSDPYVDIGDTVKKGQVLCIVEAMKLMNEIESDTDGVVREVLPKNGQPVEYGEPLFVIETT